MSEKKFTTDIVVIGAGPVGLFAIFEAGMLKMKCHVIDALEFAGGQCSALYPEKPIYDIPAHPNIMAADLIDQLEKQAAPFDPVYHFNQLVTFCEKLEDGSFLIKTSKNVQINCKAVIIAAGCGAFGPNRPPLDNLEDYEGKSVFYMVNKKENLRGKDVVIAGGGDSAVDWAVDLQGVAKSITLVHRRAKFRCAPAMKDKVASLAKEGKINLQVPYQLQGLEGEDGILQNIVLKDFDGNLNKVKADILLPFYGLAMELGEIANWGLNIDKKHIAVNQSTMQTNIKGIYAIGDIANYDKKLKLILTGFAEAASASHDIYNIVHEGEVFHFEYSTSKGVK